MAWSPCGLLPTIAAETKNYLTKLKEGTGKRYKALRASPLLAMRRDNKQPSLLMLPDLA
jgi:hypothetical protein